MDATTFDKSELPSCHVAEGSARARRHAGNDAMGLAARNALDDAATIIVTTGNSTKRHVGSVPRATRALLDGGSLHGACSSATGKTPKPNLENVKFNKNQRVVDVISQPISQSGGAVGLQGWQAPEGAIVKVAGMTKLKFRGPARVFDCEEAASAQSRTTRGRTVTSSPFAARGPRPGSPNPYQSGALRKYAEQAGPARQGAVTHAGGKAEVVCYAGI